MNLKLNVLKQETNNNSDKGNVSVPGKSCWQNYHSSFKWDVETKRPTLRNVSNLSCVTTSQELGKKKRREEKREKKERKLDDAPMTRARRLHELALELARQIRWKSRVPSPRPTLVSHARLWRNIRLKRRNRDEHA